MKPGRFDEQPIPEITANSCGLISSSAQARKSALRTPKSPQPGHQSGDTSGLKSFTSSLIGAVAVAIGMGTPESDDARLPLPQRGSANRGKTANPHGPCQ